MRKTRKTAPLAVAFISLAAGNAFAQPPSRDPNASQDNTNSRTISNVDPNARPVVNRLSPPDTSKALALTADTVSGLTPGVASQSNQTGIRAFGTFGIPYTSTRVQAGPSNQTSSIGASYLGTTYPYRTIGKLFLNGGYCSASLIARSVIVTAAHCIQNFKGGVATFGGWTFYPGHYGVTGATTAQTQPYGVWTWARVVWPTTWQNGTDTGSGSARNNDLAVIILAKNARGQFIGDLTGWMTYGWNNYSFTSSAKTGNLSVAATSTAGYPALMDSGKIMQRADGPSYLTTVSGANQIWQGNNFTGGSSGGPWIANFVSYNPALSGGAVIGTSPVMAVVGVTSWGSADPNGSKDNYSSRFGQNTQYPNAAYGIYGAGNIGSLLNTACSGIISGTTTYAAAGYCNL